MSALHWHPYRKDQGEFAEWNGFLLEAFADGDWYVWVGLVDRKGELLICHREQTPGKNMEEARQRATGAAIVYHSWLDNQPQHGQA